VWADNTVNGAREIPREGLKHGMFIHRRVSQDVVGAWGTLGRAWDSPPAHAEAESLPDIGAGNPS
jgi:hypothetical protein